MRRIALFIVGFLFFVNLSKAEDIWTEDFSTYVENTGIDGTGNLGDYPASVSKWTLDSTNSDLVDTDDYMKTVSGVMEGRDVGGATIWLSESIDISSYTGVSFSLVASESGDLESSDYFNVEYKIDAGSFTLIENWSSLGDATHTLIGDKPDNEDWGTETVTQSSLSGNSLQIRVTMNNGADTEYLRLDDIMVSGTPLVNNPTSFLIQYITSDKMSLTWTQPSGTYDNVLIFGRSGSAVNYSPSGAGSAYNDANPVWSSSGTYDVDNKLLYSGTGTSVTITGLSVGTDYYFKAYAYSGSDWSSGTCDVNDVAEVQGTSDFAAAASIGNEQIRSKLDKLFRSTEYMVG